MDHDDGSMRDAEKPRRKLQVARETLRQLGARALRGVAGGAAYNTNYSGCPSECFGQCPTEPGDGCTADGYEQCNGATQGGGGGCETAAHCQTAPGYCPNTTAPVNCTPGSGFPSACPC